MKSAPLSLSLRGLWHLTWRRRVSWRQAFVLAGTVLAVPLLAYLATRDPLERADHFLYWLAMFHLQLAVPIYCLAVFGDLIREELEANTLVFLTTRPLTRARLFLAKFICQWAWVELLALVSGSLLLAVGLTAEIERFASLTALFLATQFLAVLAFAALSALLGLIHRRFLVLGVVYGAVVEVGIGQIPTNINNLSLTHHLKTLLGNCDYLAQLYDWSPKGSLSAVLALGLAAGLFLGLGAVLFTFREYHPSEEMQK